MRLFGFNIERIKKKEEPVEFPFHYAQVVWTESAIYNGTLDDYNKEIQIIKGGEMTEQVSYTKEELKAIIESYGIPYVDWTKLDDNEDFEFMELDALTGELTEVRA